MSSESSSDNQTQCMKQSSFKDSDMFYLDEKGKFRFKRDITTWATVVKSNVSLDYYCFTNPDDEMRTTHKTSVPSSDLSLCQTEQRISMQSLVGDSLDGAPQRKTFRGKCLTFRNQKKPHKREYLRNSKDRIGFEFEGQNDSYIRFLEQVREENTNRHESWLDKQVEEFESRLIRIKLHLKLWCDPECDCKYPTLEFKKRLMERFMLLKLERPEIATLDWLYKFRICF